MNRKLPKVDYNSTEKVTLLSVDCPYCKTIGAAKLKVANNKKRSLYITCRQCWHLGYGQQGILLYLDRNRIYITWDLWTESDLDNVIQAYNKAKRKDA